jgi:hypothetical protein
MGVTGAWKPSVRRAGGRLMMFNVGIGEVLVILLVCLVVFGPNGFLRWPARLVA